MGHDRLFFMRVELHFHDRVGLLFVFRGHRDLDVFVFDVFYLHFAFELILVELLEAVENMARHSLEDEVGLVVEGHGVALPFLEDQVRELFATNILVGRRGRGLNRSFFDKGRK